MKYIMFEVDHNGLKRKVPIIFPNHLVHRQVAIALKDLIGSSKIVGAGEVSVKVKGVSGHSSTIGIKAKKGDGVVINNYDYANGIEEALNLYDEFGNTIFR